METYKTIENYTNYEVSNLGNVRNIKTKKILKPDNLKGYNRVELYKNGKSVKFLVHRLVLEVFVGKNDLMTVNHINHVRNDNRLENLQWMSFDDNMKHKELNHIEPFKLKIKQLFESGQFKDSEDLYNKIMNM
jgi:hypothetical protein